MHPRKNVVVWPNRCGMALGVSSDQGKRRMPTIFLQTRFYLNKKKKPGKSKKEQKNRKIFIISTLFSTDRRKSKGIYKEVSNYQRFLFLFVQTFISSIGKTSRIYSFPCVCSFRIPRRSIKRSSFGYFLLSFSSRKILQTSRVQQPTVKIITFSLLSFECRPGFEE